MATDFSERPLTERAVHLCVDMQRLFSKDGPWPTPWLERVLPVVTALAERFAGRTVFTRFMTPARPDEMPGMWRSYYEKWRVATREQLEPALLELMPPLARLVPPAEVIDKSRYSAFAGGRLSALLRARGTETLIVSGSETDVCVLATVLGAIDRGYRVILVRDAVCSSSDAGHDALLGLFAQRYSVQIEIAEAEEILRHWR
jgi:nicotinamidase-related amidase